MRALPLTILFLGLTFLNLSAKPLRFLVIPNVATGEEADALHAGMLKAARVLSQQKTPVEVEIDWSPVAGTDAAAQAAAVQAASVASPRPDGLILSPRDQDPAALRSAVEAAAQAGLPVVIVETPISSPLITAYVGSNHFEAGQAAANLLCKLMHEKGGVMIVGDPDRSAVVSQLEKGFISGLFGFPNVQPLYSGDYGAALPVVAPEAIGAILRKQGLKLNGVLTTDVDAYPVVKSALEEEGLHVPQVVCGERRALIDALRSGEIAGLIADSPFEIGNRAVEVLAASLHGVPVLMRNTIVGIAITAEKLDDPAVQAFLKPPVAQFLQPQSDPLKDPLSKDPLKDSLTH